MERHDFIIVGAGVFGVSTALALRERGYAVGIVNPGKIPHPLAASTDISKVVRMEYGSDTEYLCMAAESIRRWREWNLDLGETLYHEVGYLLLSGALITPESSSYEATSYFRVLEAGFTPERLTVEQRRARFPAIRHERYPDAVYHAVGGFAESGRAVEAMTARARQMGVQVYEGHAVREIRIEKGLACGVQTSAGKTFSAGHVIVCAGNSTPYLVPGLTPFMHVTGHPVFHLKPSNPRMFEMGRFPVFAADIANSGWYGFPLHPREKVVKIANHGDGVRLHPELDPREVYEEDVEALRGFLHHAIPDLADAPLVYTRRCCYTDTLDGHFWIDNHPEIGQLTVGSGGSGHGFKMAPVIGEMIADAALGGDHRWSSRYRWRTLDEATRSQEEARNVSS
ncbi:MAG: FAD-dependent oxidoreductase [Saprospiraceae bacterium]|nr:FAD-dependent oxidoreductase [Saprospiraceae bacterium]